MHDKTHANSSLQPAARFGGRLYFGFATYLTHKRKGHATARSDRRRPRSPRAPGFPSSWSSDGGVSDGLGPSRRSCRSGECHGHVPRKNRAWGLHRLTVDRLFAATGSLCIVCYDGRRGSATFGVLTNLSRAREIRELVVIPPGVYHGWKNIGDDEASIISMPSQTLPI